jgi:hypothetical protein
MMTSDWTNILGACILFLLVVALGGTVGWLQLRSGKETAPPPQVETKIMRE